MQSVTSSTTGPVAAIDFAKIPSVSGIKGKLLYLVGKLPFFGKVEVVTNEADGSLAYYRRSDLVKHLTGDAVKLSRAQIGTIHNRLLEIANPDTRQPLTRKGLSDVFVWFGEDLNIRGRQFADGDEVVTELDKLKLDRSGLDVPQLYYDEYLSELKDQLQPGDIFVRKYHEDNQNPIVDAQGLFSSGGYREAYKCSHIAIYLGEINGESWVAEASMPHGGVAQIRRVKLDDPRFASRVKNQYLVIRQKDATIAAESARLARNYVLKVWPETEVPIEDGAAPGQKYTIIEAARSLWHDPKLRFFGKQRLFKFYADYDNRIPFQWVFTKRRVFCSSFVTMMVELAELKGDREFQDMMKASAPPKTQLGDSKGFAGVITKAWYALRKGIWSRRLALQHSRAIDRIVKTKLDCLRSSPQDVVQYMLDDHEHYEPLFMINRKVDRDTQLELIAGQDQR